MFTDRLADYHFQFINTNYVSKEEIGDNEGE